MILFYSLERQRLATINASPLACCWYQLRYNWEFDNSAFLLWSRANSITRIWFQTFSHWNQPEQQIKKWGNSIMFLTNLKQCTRFSLMIIGLFLTKLARTLKIFKVCSQKQPSHSIFLSFFTQFQNVGFCSSLWNGAALYTNLHV